MATAEELTRELYGPQRTLARDRAKRLLEEDHVKQNFQRGVERQSSSQAFQTETAQSFRKHDVAKLKSSLLERSSLDPSTQNATHLNLGSDMSPKTTVVRSDFTAKPTPRFQQVIPEGVHDIHLADMAPKYMVDKSFGKSLYSSDFDGEKSYDEWSRCAVSEGRKVGRRHKTTGYQKSTHFQLGSDPPELESETSGCFTDRQPEHYSKTASNTNPSTGDVDVTQSTSNVFRAGDYNLPSRTCRGHFVTTQKQDYQQQETALPAGVTTATKKAYSHVLPRRTARGQALSTLRQLLVDENSRVFQNPRDPTSTNVTRAFLNYDRGRTGFITEESLRSVCRDLGAPISELEISQLMAECDHDRDGKISYVEFTKYLTSGNEGECAGEDMETTSDGTYSQPQQTERDESGSLEKAYMGAGYQDSTHFQFGNHFNPTTSVYTGDFSMESVRGAQRQRAVSPPSGKVMHEFPVVSLDGATATTSRQDYVSHDITSMARQRMDALNTNRSRHTQLAVEFSCGHDKSSEHHKTSVMSSSYVAAPPGTQRECPVNPAPQDYRHLESDRALLRPPSGPTQSENMAQFGTPLKSSEEVRGRIRAAQTERTSRIRDNKQTHLVLGFDSLPPLSEKMAEFGEKRPVDPSLPAAGKSNGPTQGYSVLSHECGQAEDDGRSLSEDVSTGTLQGVLQQRNFLRNMNPRDPLNINLRKAFLEYDKNLCGSISAGDLRTVCRDMQVEITDKELEALMKRCDKNDDGQIDYHEFALHLSRKQCPSASLSTTHTPSINSTTRHDFRDPATQRLTGIQQVLLDQDVKRNVSLCPTHYFHMDTRDDTTRKDYKPPVPVQTHTS